MNKLGIIIRREYLSRVQKRSFILTTLLTPLAFLLLFVASGLIGLYSGDEDRRIAVSDPSGLLQRTMRDGEHLFFSFPQFPLDTLKAMTGRGLYDGILEIPPLPDIRTKRHTVRLYSDDQLGIDAQMTIEEAVGDRLREHKIATLQIDPQALEALDTRVSLEPRPLTEGEGEDGASSMKASIGAGLGMLMGFVMYMAVFIYGMMIMRSVMEEKTSRIVEVMISSVKPFQLMLGKIIGVGAVSLTQFVIWIVTIPLLATLAGMVVGFDPDTMKPPPGAEQIDPDDAQAMIAMAYDELTKVQWSSILPLFLLYFLGGYLLYASLFAAVGSAVGDDIGESQSLTAPISIPIVLAFIILQAAIRSPHSDLAVFGSLFPLFSPIVMPARLAFEVPWWQVAISLALLAGTVLGFVWLSARIYRVGILMYGKKVTFKELGKWMFYKD